MYHLRVAQTEEELERYYQFSALVNVAQAPASTKRFGTRRWDAMAHHQMVVDGAG